MSPQWGWTGEAVASKTPVRVLSKDVATEVEVYSTKTTPAAHDAFSANELEARLEAYSEIVAQRGSLFEDGSEPDETVRNGCWGCGARPPLRENGRQTQAVKAPGWVVRYGGFHHPTCTAPEIWCPECAAMPGFGCVEEPEPADEQASLTVRIPSEEMRKFRERE